MELNHRIKLARERSGISQRELARLMNVTRSACSQWEKPGPGGPQFGRLPKLAKILDVNYEWLAAGQGTMEAMVSQAAEPETGYQQKLSSLEKKLLRLFRMLKQGQQLALIELLKQWKK